MDSWLPYDDNSWDYESSAIDNHHSCAKKDSTSNDHAHIKISSNNTSPIKRDSSDDHPDNDGYAKDNITSSNAHTTIKNVSHGDSLTKKESDVHSHSKKDQNDCSWSTSCNGRRWTVYTKIRLQLISVRQVIVILLQYIRICINNLNSDSFTLLPSLYNNFQALYSIWKLSSWNVRS